MKTLNICYYYKPEGDMDAFLFIGEATEGNAKRYARFDWKHKLKDEDIEGVYTVTMETDDKGKEYDIIIKERK